jgi:hypothetical protein
MKTEEKPDPATILETPLIVADEEHVGKGKKMNQVLTEEDKDILETEEFEEPLGVNTMPQENTKYNYQLLKQYIDLIL